MHLGKEQSTGVAVDNGDVAAAGDREHSTREHSTREQSTRAPREGRPAVRAADAHAPATTR
ncbi:MAG TPA: hypothetical protein VFA84_14000 [Acidimicrobiales bacterium]|nr:hypothetical protein [Acidimicrobiales bacterium]